MIIPYNDHDTVKDSEVDRHAQKISLFHLRNRRAGAGIQRHRIARSQQSGRRQARAL